MVKEVEYQALKSLKNDAVRGRGGKELVQNFSSKGSLAHIINGKTLRWAMASNEMALAEYLLENEVCPNLLQLALHLSSKKGNLDLCQILVSKGVYIDALDWTKRSPMFYAVFGNQNDMTNFLLEKGADPNGRGKRMKETLLHLAVRNGNFDICQKLVANGAALEALDSKNRTALSYAVMKNNIKITEYLLKNGANPNANVMTFHRSPYSGEPHICQTVLHVAVRYRFYKIVKLLIENRANVNCLNSRGQTPLMLIIRRILFSCNEKVFNEKLAMAFLLMSKDAILNEDSNVHNQEPGYVKNEVKMRWEEMGLKNSGIKDVESIRGKELVHNFSSEGSLAQRINGKTLRWAVASNEMALARYQLENEKKEQTQMGKPMKETLLHLAVRNGNFDICQKLVTNGATLEALDSKNRTALSYAVMKNNIKITEYLLKNGANPNANVMTFHRSPYS
ncbi:hypothetical protein QYM36_003735, partial [Artemia franciscana]